MNGETKVTVTLTLHEIGLVATVLQIGAGALRGMQMEENAIAAEAVAVKIARDLEVI